MENGGGRVVSSEETKEHILEAAIEVLAKHGYAGAHVSEIAEKAGANVALIYRYFGNKEQLLQTVLDQFVKACQLQREALDIQQPPPSSARQLHGLVRWAWEHLDKQRDLLKIVLFEALVDEGHNELLFQCFDTSLLSRLPSDLAERRDDEALQLLMAAFFFGVIPFLMALAIGEQWAIHYGINPERMQELFLPLVDEMYGHCLDYLDGVQHET
jgi:AcrR family transcriptional regulator